MPSGTGAMVRDSEPRGASGLRAAFGRRQAPDQALGVTYVEPRSESEVAAMQTDGTDPIGKADEVCKIARAAAFNALQEQVFSGTGVGPPRAMIG
ncbi:hypothetical protein E4U60_002351 [Claviceps pazoutovae]|uniref:Uncharacterized protein n=1 Tax=Claviceps pazoutovae TaxID=1649127 RepID=A0A9P7SG72_9HYPO|nr:hypothetical protein E4U60_002351 [Claviceps pazoutovae]